MPHQLYTANIVPHILNPYLVESQLAVFIEIDEEWQTGRGYMKMPEEDHKKDMDDTLLREIEQIKE